MKRCADQKQKFSGRRLPRSNPAALAVNLFSAIGRLNKRQISLFAGEKPGNFDRDSTGKIKVEDGALPPAMLTGFGEFERANICSKRIPIGDETSNVQFFRSCPRTNITTS